MALTSNLKCDGCGVHKSGLRSSEFRLLCYTHRDSQKMTTCTLKIQYPIYCAQRFIDACSQISTDIKNRVPCTCIHKTGKHADTPIYSQYRVFFEELKALQMVQIFLAFMESEVSSLPHSQKSVPIPNQLNPFHTYVPVSIKSILVLIFHLKLCLPSILPYDFPTNILCVVLISPTHAMCSTYLILTG
jgi:hypothetical protein